VGDVVAGEPWAPTVTDVARHIPTRTRDTKTPGSDKLLNTFTVNTTPTDAQAQQVIDDIVAALTAEFGDLPQHVGHSPDIAAAARTAVEWRAAADIEVAYPTRNADLNVYPLLNARADTARRTLQVALAAAGAGQVDLIPVSSFPPPPGWGDTSPGSGADYVTNLGGAPPYG